MIPKNYACPACGSTLKAALFNLQRDVWCSNTRCPSIVANDPGGSGRTDAEAYRDLCEKVTQESIEDLKHFKDANPLNQNEN